MTRIMKYLSLSLLALCLLARVAVAQDASTTNAPAHLDSMFKQAKDGAVAHIEEVKPDSALSSTSDTQIRLLSLFEPQTNRQAQSLAGTNQEADTYLNIENVPLKTLLHLLARRSGLNYLEPEAELPGLDETVNLEMKEPRPRQLLDWLLRHKNLELFDAGTSIYTIRGFTNEPGFYRFKLLDNFIDRFKGSAQTSGGASSGGMSGGSMGGGGGGNAISASASSIQVENGGKYGDIEGLLEKVANTGDDKNNKCWYYEEKQSVLMYGTRPASERVATYLEIANAKNPNIRIDVRIYATANNPKSNLGVDWSSMLSPGLTFGLQPGGTQVSSSGTNGAAGLFPTFNNMKSLITSFGNPMSTIVLKNDIQATLNFFVKETRAEAITEPSTITANDREVAFAATQQIPYVSGSAPSGGAGGYGNSTGGGYDNTAFVNVGANINILPRIQDGKRIKLGTAISISQLDQMIQISSGTGGSPPREVPQTSGRAFNGEFTVDSGDTVVIAGLKTYTTSKTINKVPLLGDIPGIGKLFRNTSNEKNNAYLTIFITATMLDNDNNPKIPEGHITTKDKYPDDDNTWMAAEPNSKNLLRKSLLTDKGLINAKQEALNLRTEQVNRIIASRMKLQDRVHELTSALDHKEDEIKTLEAQKKQIKGQASDRAGTIERARTEIALQLSKAKVDWNAINQDLQASKAGLDSLVAKEEAATKEKDQAETEYSNALGGGASSSTTSKALPPQDIRKTLEENQKLLDSLK
jgi:type II secretory pathway component GspD/PulD (secretin)